MTTSAPADVQVALSYPEDSEFIGTVRELVADRVAGGIAAGDATLWGPEAEAEAAIRLSWVGLAESSRPLVAEIEDLRAELAADGLDHIVLAGMGGSSLAPEVITATAGVELVTLDTTDAGQVRAAIGQKLDRTVVVVSSKSGGTVETDSHCRAYSQAFLDAGLSEQEVGRRFVIVTDPGSPLEQTAKDFGARRLFLADPHVGGRYSALTAFGLVPAGLAGADIAALLDEAAAVSVGLATDDDENPGLRLGALLGLAHRSGAEKVVLADTGSGIVGFGDWAEQLIAESTGKNGKGLLPVVVESVGAPGFADAGPDAIQVVLGPDPAIDRDRSITAYGAGVQGSLGGQMLLWEYAVVVAGRLIGINPFDQPNVEEAKKQARSMLDADSASTGDDSPTFTDGAVEVRTHNLELRDVSTLGGALDALLGAAPERGYVSVQAYLDRMTDTSATDLRPGLARRSGRQTTFGWGPRFLHSTGQYHKGGHPNGVFLQITGAIAEDLAIPGRPYGFARLQSAQAAGDASVLAEHGRPVLRLHLTDRAAGLGQLLEAL